MPDVMVVGSYNAGLTVYTDRLPTSGQTVVGSDLNDGPGGKGANQAIGIHRLGVDVGLVVKIGKDAFGERARQMLAGEGLPAAGILTGDRPTGMAMIIVDGAGDNLIVVAPGANGELGWGEVMHRFRAELNQCRWIVLQLECPTELAVAAARWARANGKRTVLDPAPCRGLTADTVGLFDILTPNESELAELGTLVGLSGRSVVEQATGLVDLGVPDVVATLGENGVLWASERGWSELGGYKVEAVDTTGAGDAFNAALVASLSRDETMAQALDLGCRAGAWCVMHRGVVDGLPTPDQLASLDTQAGGHGGPWSFSHAPTRSIKVNAPQGEGGVRGHIG